MKATVTLPAARLQWGRNFFVTEIPRPVILSIVTHFASMGP